MPRQDHPCFKLMYCLYAKTSIGSYYYGRDVEAAKAKYPAGHSLTEPLIFGDLQVLPIPYSLDNYCYAITDRKDSTTVLVDVGDADRVSEVLESCKPTAILSTHKHWDHCDGNKAMKQRHRGLRVIGSREDKPSGCTEYTREADLVFGNLRFRALLTPGHTVGHTVYILDGAPYGAPKMLFSGDLLFLGGVGRNFESTWPRMLASLDACLALPPDTLLFPGHEYSANNLDFATYILSDTAKNKAESKLTWVNQQREQNKCTVPSTLSEEMDYNPALRTADPILQASLGLQPEATDQTRARALEALRKEKDNYKYIG